MNKMNNIEQEVLQQNKLMRLLIQILLLLTFCLTHSASAEILTANAQTYKKDTLKHHVLIIYSPDNTLQSNIIQKLSENLKLKNSDIVITKTNPEEKIKTIKNNTGIVIGIGYAGIKSASKYYPKSKKLFIATDPGKYRLDTNKNNAILYMTQSYCRQIQFIKLLNKNWRTISILSSWKKPINSTATQRCADKHDMEVYITKITADDNLSNKIKSALKRSDVLLALPDKHIYNSKTVKNILLTSYRHRKPVIAFSKNFVNAGALAAVYSSTEQIAQSASNLIKQYFKTGDKFKKQIHYPQEFNVSINRQVFNALNLIIPDIKQIKQVLKNTEINGSSVLQ